MATEATEMRRDDDHDIYHEVTVVGGGRRYFTHSTAPLADKDAYRQSVRGCKVHLPDPYFQRYHFWMPYAREHST